jgi:YD repeat-containing protein
MVRTIGRGAALLLCLGSVWSSGALAQTSATRQSGFGYNASGLLSQEIVEPNNPALRLTTAYSYDAFGNKTIVTVSGADITTRTVTTNFDAQGQFATSNANALNQSESWQYDPRFGTPTSHTGPNGLTTTWTYDSFGRKTREVRADGTQTFWGYLFCSGFNGGTTSCPVGAVYVIVAVPLDANGNQNGPRGSVYFDNLDREIQRFTDGFDGSYILASKQYDSFGRVQQQSPAVFCLGRHAAMDNLHL